MPAGLTLKPKYLTLCSDLSDLEKDKRTGKFKREENRGACSIKKVKKRKDF